MKNVFQLAIISGALIGALFSSGCASVFRGSSEKLIVQSVPSGAEVKLSTGQAGVTPWEVEVKRKDTIFVSVKKDGYKPLETAVISSIDGASLGIGTAANFLFLPVVNDIVDYKTGANYSHKPNPLVVTLIPQDSAEDYKLIAPPEAKPAEAPKTDTAPAPVATTESPKA